MYKVKLFDEEHEKDLEEALNSFLKTIDEDQLLDIKYQLAVTKEDESDQIYCFSAMVVYKV